MDSLDYEWRARVDRHRDGIKLITERVVVEILLPFRVHVKAWPHANHAKLTDALRDMFEGQSLPFAPDNPLRVGQWAPFGQEGRRMILKVLPEDPVRMKTVPKDQLGILREIAAQRIDEIL